MAEAYCVKDKMKVEVQNPQRITMKNGKTAIQGTCPKCGGQVFETEGTFLCEKSQAEKRPCKFKINKTILQQPIQRVQAAKLLSDNRSDLLTQFISKTGRPFSAYLVMDDMGKVTFEFPPREEETKSYAE